MWLPTALYEALPYLYGVLAILAVLMVGSSIAWFSAALFAAAGAMVWRMRRNHRRDTDELHVIG